MKRLSKISRYGKYVWGLAIIFTVAFFMDANEHRQTKRPVKNIGNDGGMTSIGNISNTAPTTEICPC